MSYLKQRKVMIEEFVKSGIIDPDLENRRSGRTTAMVLATIAKAMLNKDTAIKLEDHINNETYYLNKVIVPILKKLISKLGIEGISLDKQNLTITYSLSVNDRECL